MGVEIPTLLTVGGGRLWQDAVSTLNLDTKGQNCAVTMRWRSRFSTVWPLNPLGVLSIRSIGFNPLARIDPRSSRLTDRAQLIADALIEVGPNETQPHFGHSARSLLTFLICWEIIDAARHHRVPSLPHVRDWLTEPVETATAPNGDSIPIRGLPATAGRAVASGDARVLGLAARFTRSSREIDSIISTADTATRWLMSMPVRDDLVKDGADFRRLRKEPISCYVILPAHELEAFKPWLRLVVSTALSDIYEQGGTPGLRVIMLLSEFAALGRLDTVTSALAQGAGYGVQLVPVLQDINQLRSIYGREQAETFLGMSGATLAFAPNDLETAELLSRRSGERRYVSLSASDDPAGPDPRMSYQEKRERNIPADAMFRIPEFHALTWFAGHTEPQPVHAAPYWTLPECRGRYDADPYHHGGARR